MKCYNNTKFESPEALEIFSCACFLIPVCKILGPIDYVSEKSAKRIYAFAIQFFEYSYKDEIDEERVKMRRHPHHPLPGNI